MLSEQVRDFTRAAWEKTRPSLGGLGDELAEQLTPVTGDERVLLELALATLPASDAAGVPFSVLRAYARHALMLRRESPFCREVPEEIFLHHVFYPRINSEELVDCRAFFHGLLQPLVCGKSAAEAALAVNRWCASKMTYESTDDRTIDPLTAYRCGLGRCGEESTFVVTALRSVGLPARQVYAPWWSHCDDNHAWVEVYIGGDWHFFGACEPEPVLDRGWFVHAASRAMMICDRRFFDYTGKEQPVLRLGCCRLYAQTKRYAEIVPVSVKVLTQDGKPAAGAAVRFSVINMARPALIAELTADAAGLARLELGRGSCCIEAELEGFRAETAVSAADTGEVTLCLCGKEPETGLREWDMQAPAPGRNTARPLTAAQNVQKAEELDEAAAKRQLRRERQQNAIPATGSPQLDALLQQAGANGSALSDFVRRHGKPAEALLLSLSSKDFRDAEPAVLEAHLKGAEPLSGRGNALFVPYVQCPRIGLESLSDWRTPILQALSGEQKERFAADPRALWSWIAERFPDGDCRWYPTLWLRPECALRLGHADEKGRRLLFAAVLRTLSVPARLSPVDGRPQYAEGAVFRAGEPVEEKAGTVCLSVDFPQPLRYGQDWTLSRREGGWQTLNLAGRVSDGLPLPRGLYRLLTVNRLPNGSQLVRENTFRLTESLTCTVEKRTADPDQLLADYPVFLPDLSAERELRCYLEPGAEPSEHLLNELLEQAPRAESCVKNGLRFRIFAGQEDCFTAPKLQRLIREIPGCIVEHTDLSDPALDELARSIYGEPGQWPLILLTEGMTAKYGHTGYAVGSVSQVLTIAEYLEKQ